MSLLKDEATTRLDDLNLAAAEALGLYEDIGGRIDDKSLSGILTAQISAQRTLLERIADLRRARGELPHAADPERSHLEAAEAFVRANLLPGESSTHYVESVLDAASTVQRYVDGALSLCPDDEMRALLEELGNTNAAFEAALRSRL